MKDNSVIEMKNPDPHFRDYLTEILQAGCQEILKSAPEAEIADFLEHYKEFREENGRQRIVRNGYLPEREIQTGVGQIKALVPRSRDRQPEGQPVRFSSTLIPPYLRRSRSIEELLPWLYLKGISSIRVKSKLKKK